MRLEVKKAIVNGSRMRYLQGGKGKSLLFLHGWPSQPLAYRQALELLADRFTVSAPYMFDTDCNSAMQIAESVRKFAKLMGISAATLVGISFGGIVASFLSQDKKLVSRLVLVGTAGVPREASFARMLFNFLKSSTRMLIRGDVGHLFSRYTSVISFFVLLKSVERRRLFAEIKASTKTHACHIFQKIPVRTTIIWPTRDDVFPASAAAVLNKMIPNSRLIIVEGDHYWPFHHPGKFAGAILSALRLSRKCLRRQPKL